jgi:hypothetical protein
MYRVRARIKIFIDDQILISSQQLKRAVSRHRQSNTYFPSIGVNQPLIGCFAQVVFFFIPQ